MPPTATSPTVAVTGTTVEWAGALSPEMALLLTLVTLVFGYGLYRLSSLAMLSKFRPYILAGLVVTWGFAIVEAFFAIAHLVTTSWVVVGLFMIAVLVATNLSWVQNVMAGVTLAFERRLEIGDAIRFGEIDGEVEGFGLRAVRVRGEAGKIYNVPNRRLVDETLTELAAEGDSRCQLVVDVPEGTSVDRARHVARRAASLTPYASPRHEPSIFVESGDEGERDVELRVCGFAYHSSQRNAYRSDVTERILEDFGEGGAVRRD